MRYIDSVLKERLEKAHQTLYNNANPAMNIWISRNSTPITNEIFWERLKIGDFSAVNALSLAARRTDIRRQADRIYIAFCKNGAAYIKNSLQTSDLTKMTWIDAETISDAIDISLAFDGKMVKTIKGTVEFQTDGSPWMLWCTASGELYAKILGDDSTLSLLTNQNCTKVSAIREMYSDISDFDQGLLVFFILNGALYYRTLKSGIWNDAVPVNFGPSSIWMDLSVSRTWDYRIVLQVLDSGGNVYELFTYTEGIAKQNVERINLTNIAAAGEAVPIKYTNSNAVENIGIADTTASASIIYGHSPVPISVMNTDDGTGDWGKQIVVGFDYEVAEIDGSARCFVLTDENNLTYVAQTIEYAQEGTTRAIKLGFLDINPAYQMECTLTYTPGTIKGPAVLLAAFSSSFMPINLVLREPAKPISATNISSTQIMVEFDRNISSSDFTALAGAFIISGQEYNYVPGGTVIDKEYVISSVAMVAGETKKLLITLTGLGRLKAPLGEVTVGYNATLGNLMSDTGAVLSFSLSFILAEIVPVNNPNDIERIEVTDIIASGNLIRIYYSDSTIDECMDFVNITVLGALININDL